VHPDAAGIVLMLGDQPEVDTALVRRLLAEGSGSPVTVCRYTDGIGHPFWLSRSVFGELAQLHGDKGIWKLIESGSVGVHELAVDGTVPLDVDTWDDYRRLVESVPQ
jgi:molybdenum cofactor cytidylyltransferase